jgi:ribA/ribD-fused uncharacterized protein
MRVGNMDAVINSFRGEHAFLSNYDVNPFVWRGLLFHSGEQAFAYAKTFFAPADRQYIFQENILATTAPGDAKKFGRACPIDVAEWDKRKVHYMREITHAKFGYVKDYAGKLINTGASPLVEGNTWGDTFWGKCRVEGKVVGLNMLGTILMEERGYWLWYGQANSDVVVSPLTAQHVERTADYG